MFKKLKAFTLAEALIVIVVIGVIAVLTVPTVFSNYQRKGFEAALKKNYHILSSVLERYERENYEKLSYKHRSTIAETLKKYLQVTHQCYYGKPLGKFCSAMQAYRNNAGVERVYGAFDDYTYSSFGMLVLNDGTYLRIGFDQDDPDILYIMVDVNGAKAQPNRFGFDTFLLTLDSKGVLKPMGEKNTRFPAKDYCVENDEGKFASWGCAYDIIMNRK